MADFITCSYSGLVLMFVLSENVTLRFNSFFFKDNTFSDRISPVNSAYLLSECFVSYCLRMLYSFNTDIVLLQIGHKGALLFSTTK